MAALEQAAGDGAVVLTDLGSAVMTAESAAGVRWRSRRRCCSRTRPWWKDSWPQRWLRRAGPSGRRSKDAAEAVVTGPPTGARSRGGRGRSGTGSRRTATGDFELVNQAGMHARPAAKMAGGLSALDADVTVNGVDGASMTELMTLAAGKGSVLHVEAWGADAANGGQLPGAPGRLGLR